MNQLEYKGFFGTIEYSAEDKVLFGKVLGINSLLSYEGDTGAALDKDFQQVIDEYLADCTRLNKAPEKTSYITYNVDIPSDLIPKVSAKALERQKPLKEFITDTILSNISN